MHGFDVKKLHSVSGHEIHEKNSLLATNLLHSNWTQLLRDLPDFLKKILQDENMYINIMEYVVNL